MPKLLDSDDDEANVNSGSALKINEDYATSYQRWRQKEEYQRLKDKYGEEILSEDSVASSNDNDDDSSDSSEEEEEDLESKVFDEEFLKVYGALKSKDPTIYDEKVKFFENEDKNEDESEIKSNSDDQDEQNKKDKVKGMSILDYHKVLVQQKHGITEEDEMMEEKQNKDRNEKKATYNQEMDSIKKEFKSFLDNDEDGDDDDLIKGVKPIPVKVKQLKPEEVLATASDRDERIKFLKGYWNKNDLDEREKFLKDYILKKKYLDPNEARENDEDETTNEPVRNINDTSGEASLNRNDSSDEDGGEDKTGNKTSSLLESITSSYHFQEQDAEVIKRYPRTIESVRDIKTLSSRLVKRSEIKERKKREKQEALQRFRELKRAEVKEKLAKLKEISGNERLLKNDADIDLLVDDITDFDPDKYDQRMSQLFSDDYYNVSKSSDDKKPKFDYIPGIDDVDDNLNPIEKDDDEIEPILNKKKAKKGKKGKDPAAKKNIGIYEDIVGGDIPTRFKYRTVQPNDFGLTPEELLLADDKELNKWVSLKKTCQYRSKEEETYDAKVYERKKDNVYLKKKVLKSIYSPKAEGDLKDDSDEGEIDEAWNEKKKLLEKLAKAVGAEVKDRNEQEIGVGESSSQVNQKKSKKRKRKRKSQGDSVGTESLEDKNIQDSSEKVSKKKRKMVKLDQPIPEQFNNSKQVETVEKESKQLNKVKRKRNRKRTTVGMSATSNNRKIRKESGLKLTAERLKSYDLPYKVIKKTLS